MKRFALIFGILLTANVAVRGDGKIYGEKVPPSIPYQRALLLWEDGKETLFLQSRFDVSGDASTNAAFGWVVPVPSIPSISSTNAVYARVMFGSLSFITHPIVTPIRSSLVLLLFLVTIVGGLCWLILILLSPFVPKLRAIADRYRLGVFGLCLAAMFGVGILVLRGIGTAGVESVDVIHSADVGIYSTKVIKASSSADLIQWLNENGFQFAPSDNEAVNRHIQVGWCFVVAKVRPGEKAITADGLIDPLILRFEAKLPIYPLALTSTIGKPTEILIYTLSDRKLDCGQRLQMAYAGPGSPNPSLLDSYPVFVGWETNLTYLCKFRGRLESEQMKEDLVFTAAPDNNPYREHIFKW